MSINELDSKVSTYFDLLAQIKALEEEAEAIKDSLKAHMVEEATETISGHGWSATWHNTRSTRFDSKAFKAAHADLYAQYTRQAVSTRFTLQPVKA